MALSKQSGVGIIEILVALLIASIGLLGIVAIQTKRVQLAQQEIQSSMATILAAEMAERLRANTKGVVGGAYSDATTNDDYTVQVCSPCSKTQIANNDLLEWKTKVEDKLIEGLGKIVASGDNYTITLSWTEKGKHSDTDNTIAADEKNRSKYSITVYIKEIISDPVS